MIRSAVCEGPLTKTLIAPLTLNGMTAAFEIAPSLGVQFRLETVGIAVPCGQATRLPVLVRSVTAKLKETAAAKAGMPHCPVMAKLRVAPADSAGVPYCPVNPLPRVSATRHGVTPT